MEKNELQNNSEDSIKEIVESIFSHLGCSITSFEFSDEGGIRWCMIGTPDSRFIIGRDGETLRSFNHLVQKMIERNSTEEESSKIFIDVNGYQKKRFDNLRATAHMMAERARYFKSNIETEPMPAYERRVIHLFLEGVKDIKTESEGMGPQRRVVIKYVSD